MTNSDSDNSRIRWAKLAGFMYLYVDVAYGLGVTIANRLEVPGNFVETARRIMGAELLYRIGLSSMLVGSLCTVFLAMGLYVTLKPINRNLALLALLFRMVEATIFGIECLFSFIVLRAFMGSDSLHALGANQPSLLMNLRSAVYADAFTIAGLFFSMGSVLFFYLFARSSYIPKVLSILGLVSSALVTVTCLASLVFPHPAKLLQLGWAPIAVAEFLVGVWLMLKGVNLQPRELKRTHLHSSDRMHGALAGRPS